MDDILAKIREAQKVPEPEPLKAPKESPNVEYKGLSPAKVEIRKQMDEIRSKYRQLSDIPINSRYWDLKKALKDEE